jgi:hypothetical protein
MRATERDELTERLRAATGREAVAMADWEEARNGGYDVEGCRRTAMAAQAEREAIEARLRRG